MAFGCLALLHRQRLLPGSHPGRIGNANAERRRILVIPLALSMAPPLLMPDSVTGKRRLLPDAPHLLRHYSFCCP